MTSKTLIYLTLFTLLSPLAFAQFSFNFTGARAAWGPKSIFVVPSNITDPDGTQYWTFERRPINEPEGQWTLQLYNPDGSVTSFQNVNNNLVLVQPDGSQVNLASQIPSIVGISGSNLVNVMQNNVQAAVESAYSNPDKNNVTNAEVNTYAEALVNQILSSSKLPGFFLSPFRNQAESQIKESLANAQAVSAAINAKLEAEKPESNQSDGNVENNESDNNGQSEEAPTGNTIVVSIPINLTGLDLSVLDEVTHIEGVYGNKSASANITGKVDETPGDQYATYNAIFYSGDSEAEIDNSEDNTEWQLMWTTGNESYHLVNNQGKIEVVDSEGNVSDISKYAAWYAGAENGDIDAAITELVSEFLSAAHENLSAKGGNVAIEVGPQEVNLKFSGNSTA